MFQTYHGKFHDSKLKSENRTEFATRSYHHSIHSSAQNHGNVLIKIPQPLPQVTDGATLTDRGLTQLARRCPDLQHLQLHHCPQLGDAALAEMAARCGGLSRLDLTGCAAVTTLSVAPGPGPEPPRRLLLQYLDLTDCEAVQDAGLRVIVRNCPQLVYLYLRRCVNITGVCVRHCRGVERRRGDARASSKGVSTSAPPKRARICHVKG